VARARSEKAAAPPPFELPEPELVVVVQPEAGFRATAEGLAAEAADTKPLETALGTATLQPLFGPTEDRLRYELAEAATFAAAPLPDLTVFYRVEAPAGQLDRLASALAKVDVVEAAYVKPPAEPAQLNDMAPAPEDAPPVTPDFTARQGYLDAAPGGIDARFAWTLPGGRGAGVGTSRERGDLLRRTCSSTRAA
jgi:hypothetical protein